MPQILKDFETKTWQLLYRGTRDGFGSTDFHAKCDEQSNTVAIILTTNGSIFGGFTPIAWDSSSGDKPDNTGKSFLFSLKNPRDSEPKIFPPLTDSTSIYCGSAFGPVFGAANEIQVGNNCDQNKNSYTRLGNAYRNNTGIIGTQVFTGEQFFQVAEI
jgi:hypothetical protein